MDLTSIVRFRLRSQEFIVPRNQDEKRGDFLGMVSYLVLESDKWLSPNPRL